MCGCEGVRPVVVTEALYLKKGALAFRHAICSICTCLCALSCLSCKVHLLSSLGCLDTMRNEHFVQAKFYAQQNLIRVQGY